ncbi:uncharacterized protein CLUP02_13820 [Colletotrichum lupini]|uniref:Uncharacterized protein n=1 Tax=Colletotrichum lupini TaxID=145971 RepID=A0A9Q8WMH4_9PEZI|nr:uncharacterized protein CLUP02_13820 [Colletotrichum lupini]UQC88297.1 hypothetical protein CLUP02_13820 [Colletotrichum lupini]
MEIPGLPLTAVVDIFRFQGSCIVEHWDVATAMPPNATNPLALFECCSLCFGERSS